MRLLHSLIFISMTMQIAVGQTQYDLIENAYKKKSIQMLTQFFDNWSNEISPNNSEIKNDTIKEAYNVFKGFYHPTQLSTLGGSEWGNSLYMNSKYFLVQTKLNHILFVDKLFYTDKEKDSITVSFYTNLFKNDTVRLKNELKRDANGNLMPYVYENWDIGFNDMKILKAVDSIEKFYPTIDYKDIKAVYLIPKYQDLMDNFLGNSYNKLGKGGIMNPARSKGASKKRKAFIDNLITTFYGHWGGYWQLNTYPYINSITFDKYMKYAKVDFRLVYEGGEALLKKEGEKWILINSKRTWIE